MQKEGRLVKEFSGDNVDGSTNIIPKMGLDALREGYRQILSQIYAPKLYYERVVTFLREYQPPKIRIHLEPQYVLALWRSIYQLGIRGRRARPILAALLLDAVPPSAPVSRGDHAGDLRFSFPPGDCLARHLSIHTMKCPDGCFRTQQGVNANGSQAKGTEIQTVVQGTAEACATAETGRQAH